MALEPGDRLGPYEVQSLLGAGGMGEVYRGRDTRLGRDVALKVISTKLVGDPSSRRRFELEARAASALNHPAIVTIYDVGQARLMYLRRLPSTSGAGTPTTAWPTHSDPPGTLTFRNNCTRPRIHGP